MWNPSLKDDVLFSMGIASMIVNVMTDRPLRSKAREAAKNKTARMNSVGLEAMQLQDTTLEEGPEKR
jgi:hypothetical protein